MPNQTPAQKKASKKYHAKLDSITIRIPKGTKEIYKAYASRAQLSLTKFIMTAVEEKTERDGLKK